MVTSDFLVVVIGLDNFGARYNSSQYGRFMTPDPLTGRITDPQTLNKYA